jgi:hypothetical protein
MPFFEARHSLKHKYNIDLSFTSTHLFDYQRYLIEVFYPTSFTDYDLYDLNRTLYQTFEGIFKRQRAAVQA